MRRISVRQVLSFWKWLLWSAILFTSALGAVDAQTWGVRRLLDNTTTPTIRLTDKSGKEIETVSRSSIEMVNRVSGRLSATYGFSPPELFVSKQDGPNAFVTMGSGGPVMVVGTDMLHLVGNDEDLLAVVIGHEYGHLKGNHLTAGRANMAVIDLLGMLAGLALDIDQAKKGVDTQGLGMQLGNVGAGLVNAKFSRDQEREADAFGIDRMARAGYDPSSAARLWALMERQGSGGNGLWMSSHPSPSERFKTLQSAASGLTSVYLANKSNSETQVASRTPSNIDAPQSKLQEAMSAMQRSAYPEAFNIYSVLANQGNAVAQANFARMYMEGKGTQADDGKAAYWFQKAADQGNIFAQANLGFLYERGRGVPNDDSTAVSWYRKAADLGYAYAQGNLGFMYSAGRGVKKDEVEAVRWYKAAADQGSTYAQGRLGIMYATGRGVTKDESEAVGLFRKAAERGDPVGQANLAYSYENGRGTAKDETEAFNWYSKSASQGNSFAQNNLGMMYLSGRGVRKDESEAFKFFKRSADQGFAAGQYSVSTALNSGRGVTKDESQAFAWAMKAAQQGHAGAQNNVGYLYSQGKGVPLNHVEALSWYRKSAAQGNAVAQANIGEAYRDGLAVEKNDQEALNWYRLSAGQGYANAQKELGDIYRTGRSVARDENEAAGWYRKAIANGNTSATNALNDMVGAQRAEKDRLAEQSRLAEQLEAQKKVEQERVAVMRRQEEVAAKEKVASSIFATPPVAPTIVVESKQPTANPSASPPSKVPSAEALMPVQFDRTDVRRVGQDSDDGAKAFASKLTECDRGTGKACRDAASEILAGTAMTDVMDTDTRKRLALDLLEKGIKAGDADALLVTYDIYFDSKLPSVIAFMSPKNMPPIVSALEKSDLDSAKVRVAFHNLTTLDPFKVIFGTLGGSMTNYCNQIRLLKAKGLTAERDVEYANKGVATVYCSK